MTAPSPAISTATHGRRLTWIAAASIGVALAVMGIKYLAYLWTGSVALLSDALESIVNVVTAVVALLAIRYSGRPADANHQFGHHKAEYFAAVLEGVLITVAALLIIREATFALIRPHALETSAIGFGIAVLATGLNAGWSLFLVNRGRLWRSPALTADGWHLMTDVVTSIGVLLGLGLVVLTGWRILDPLIALAVAVNIVWAGWRVIKESLYGLLDTAVAPDVLSRIQAIITEQAGGALQVHDLRTRTAGRATFVEFHMVVPGSMTVAAAHHICDRIEAALIEALPDLEVLIHIEPHGEAKSGASLVV